MKTLKFQAEAPAQHPHLYELMAPQDSVRPFWGATSADLSGFSDDAALLVIRPTCGTHASDEY